MHLPPDILVDVCVTGSVLVNVGVDHVGAPPRSVIARTSLQSETLGIFPAA